MFRWGGRGDVEKGAEALAEWDWKLLHGLVCPHEGLISQGSFSPRYSEGWREVVIGGRKRRYVLYVQTSKDGVASLGLWQS